MSELTQCNYCSLRAIARSARQEGMKIIAATYKGQLGGTNVFVVPKTISKSEVRKWKDCDKCPPNGDENYRKYFCAWFMEITETCHC